ncbi:tRNA (guanosine(37)-N1)-methyltransferase TrmD [Aquabacterium sp. J223]|uniref:tRNA (guanosine(37)-N1)-methyltransferase TrmD n=1 Tax=Aquabacterium sp. J223 TaxID=2898431 RepID=UPI0021AE2A99|nr:tRNA (guanosine(37)-N1)-methyltransferase TrmD [Aquabacterium sp. J223]UUX97668.1 tRNA (guanosine(37)-N1)-methyltransferase TrmD [Aquabacterium sp. J223]
MRFDVITLFPELFAPHLAVGVTRRAFDGPVQVRLWPLRDFAEDAYRRVDDRPYGGGPGMVMLAQPLQRAVAAIRADRGQDRAGAPLVHFTPTGRRLDQALVERLAAGPGALLLCGRYEGVDQRFIDDQVDLELSLGDFVLSGGELPALALLDAVARLQPGVLNDQQSHQQDSFSDGLLEGPHYSRPEVLDTVQGAQPVPPVLLSGHHAQIERWRREQALARTARRRPDLIDAARAAGRLSPADERYLASLGL